MENNQDLDYQQVFVVDETDGYNNESTNHNESHSLTDESEYGDSNNTSRSIATVLFCFLALGAIGVFASLLFSSVFHISKMDFIQLCFVTGLCLALTLLLFLGSRSAVDKQAVAVEYARLEIRRDRKRPKKKKKFNTLQEFQNSPEGAIHQVAYDSNLSAGNNNAEQVQKDKDDIELAVEALVRLGLGKRKAIDWVSRAMKAGIKPSETQKLVKFALSRGTV